MAEVVHRKGFAPTQNRVSKASKILKILEEASGAEVGDWRVLDIGTGSGEISQIMGERFDVVSVDIVDQRDVRVGFDFIVSNETLPFAQGCFDAVVSNHVIEHVQDQDLHLSEIARVLKPGGILYLATPNRLWPWEVHYRLPVLHYLPRSVFQWLLKAFGRFHEELRLMDFWTLRRMLGRYFHVRIYSDCVMHDPGRYFMECPHWAAVALRRVPLAVLRRLAFLHPTFIFVLERKQA